MTTAGLGRESSGTAERAGSGLSKKKRKQNPRNQNPEDASREGKSLGKGGGIQNDWNSERRIRNLRKDAPKLSRPEVSSCTDVKRELNRPVTVAE